MHSALIKGSRSGPMGSYWILLMLGLGPLLSRSQGQEAGPKPGEAYPLSLAYGSPKVEMEPKGLQVVQSRGRKKDLPLRRPIPLKHETRMALVTATTSTLWYEVPVKDALVFAASAGVASLGGVEAALGRVRFSAALLGMKGEILAESHADLQVRKGAKQGGWVELDRLRLKSEKIRGRKRIRLRLRVQAFDSKEKARASTPKVVFPLGVMACWGHPRIMHAPVPDRSPAVFLLTFDTLRADGLSASHQSDPKSVPETPTFDALAGRGYFFENCFSPTSWTLPAYQAMLSGLHPAQLGYGQASSHDPNEDNFSKIRYGRAPNLPTTLRKAGRFQCLASTGGGMLEPWQNNFLKGFPYYWANPSLEPLPDSESVMRTEAWYNAERFKKQLQRFGGGSIFGFYHTYEPHTPYNDTRYVRGMKPGRVKPPFGEGKYLYGAIKALYAEYKDHEKAYVKALYNGDIAASDEALALLLKSIDEAGLTERAWIIVTSDHGEEFWEHGGMSHGHSLYDELLRVPLIIVPPGGLKKGVRIKAKASLLDLYPTICSLLELASPKRMLGRDLRPLLTPMEAERDKVRMVEPPGLFVACGTYHGPSRWAVRKGPWKYIHSKGVEIWKRDAKNVKMLRLEPEELYDLRSDPGEKKNLAGDKKYDEQRIRMKKALALMREGPLKAIPLSAGSKTSVLPEPDPAVLEKLKKLGY